MERKFLIDGKLITVYLRRISSNALLNDISTVGEMWRKSISGDKKIEFEGTTENGENIEGVFRIISQSEDGIIEIEPWENQPGLGRGD